MTEEYEFYTPFKMLFISLSLGAQSTSNFTHSYNSPANSSCCSSGVPRNRVSLCVLLRRLRQGQRRLCASVGRGAPAPTAPAQILCTCVHSGPAPQPSKAFGLPVVPGHGALGWLGLQPASGPYLILDMLIAQTSALTNN